MTSGTSLVGIATFEQTTQAACVAKLLGRSPETVTPEDLRPLKVHLRNRAGEFMAAEAAGSARWSLHVLCATHLSRAGWRPYR